MEISHQPKGRAWGWQNQAGEKHRVNGVRRSRCSFGNPLGGRLPAGCEVARTHPGQANGVACGVGSSTPEAQRLIADTAYDSDLLRFRLRRRSIQLIVPHKINRKSRPRGLADPCVATAQAGNSNALFPGLVIIDGSEKLDTQNRSKALVKAVKTA